MKSERFDSPKQRNACLKWHGIQNRNVKRGLGFYFTKKAKSCVWCRCNLFFSLRQLTGLSRRTLVLCEWGHGARWNAPTSLSHPAALLGPDDNGVIIYRKWAANKRPTKEIQRVKTRFPLFLMMLPPAFNSCFLQLLSRMTLFKLLNLTQRSHIIIYLTLSMLIVFIKPTLKTVTWLKFH